MKLVGTFILALVANALGLFAIDYLIDGVTVSKVTQDFASITVIMTIANTIIRPIVKIILSPLILVTLGLFTIVINAGILYLVDIFYPELTITGLLALVTATIIMALVNAGVRLITKF